MPFVYAPTFHAATPGMLTQTSRTRTARLDAPQCPTAAMSNRPWGYRADRVSRTRLLHRTTIVEVILIVLDDSRDGVKRIAAISILGGIL